MRTELLKEYAQLKIESKMIDARLTEIQPEIIKDMEAEGFDKVPTPIGSFTFATRKNWKYSPAVVEAEEALKKMKESEQQTGQATFSEQRTLMFTQAKPKETEE